MELDCLHGVSTAGQNRLGIVYRICVCCHIDGHFRHLSMKTNPTRKSAVKAWGNKRPYRSKLFEAYNTFAPYLLGFKTTKPKKVHK